MTKLKQVYKCNVCGNMTQVVHESAGELACCNQPMQLMEENTQDAAVEKHVPVIEKNDDGVVVTVGSVSHPMDEEHYIEWIEISTDKGTAKKFLKAGDEPKASFPVKAENVSARAYCNIHGLWKSE